MWYLQRNEGMYRQYSHIRIYYLLHTMKYGQMITMTPLLILITACRVSSYQAEFASEFKVQGKGVKAE